MFKKFIKPVYAHCDVPCGIYETDTMTHAAATVKRMMEKYEALKDDLRIHEVKNEFFRIVMTKEEHAQKCKDELYLLWSDYFKPEHLEQFPELHETFWKATKQCSTVKQSLDIKEAEKLEKMVHDVSDIFAESKK